MSKETAIFSGANGESLCNISNSSGYSRSTSRIYPLALFSLTEFTSKPSTFFDHLNPRKEDNHSNYSYQGTIFILTTFWDHNFSCICYFL